MDVDRKIVLFATVGKGKDTLERFREHLRNKGVDAQQIQEVCCDMSPAFIRGIEEYFPDAEITFDNFHVMKLVGEAVNEVRIEEQNQTPRTETDEIHLAEERVES